MPLYTLTLTANGPDPDEFTIHGKERGVKIDNQLGVTVVFMLSPPRFLQLRGGPPQLPPNQLEVPPGLMEVQVGASGGEYSYEDPTSKERATRSGRINVE